MRVTSARLLELASAANASGQSRVADASAAMTSGLRVEKPSDDPTAWLAAQRATVRRTLATGTGAAVAAGRERLDQTDAALASIGDAVAQIRTLAVQGANDSYNASDRMELGVQIRSLAEAALAAANGKATDGEYLLAGTAALVAPFDASGNYVGNSTTRQLPISEGASSVVTIAGSELTAANGVDVLPLLDKVATALAANDTATLATCLTDLDTAVKQVALARTRTGGAMAVMDETRAAQSQLEQNLTEEIANHVEIDAAAAASELAQASQSLEVSRAVSSHLIQLLDPRAV